jgi:methyltransferase (TIGR00027 family)
MAESVAISRAVHQFLDEPPLVFDDPLAVRILGAAADRAMRRDLEMRKTEGLRRARGAIVIRSRFAEDELQRAIDGGATQYVILGAGLDTFAYRRADLAGRLTLYEVDQPATQQWKQERLAEAGIEAPPHLRFVPLDFNTQSLDDGLAGAGFRRDQPVFFSWLGVSYYLPLDAVRATLRFVAGQQAPSALVFDYAVAESAVPPRYRHMLPPFLAYLATTSEPWQTWFVPEELTNELRGMGFTHIAHLDADQSTARYLAGRMDGLLPSPLVGLISAQR